jgi:universal stress protein A
MKGGVKMLEPTKILVPTDFSKHSDKALKQAFDIAQEYKAKAYVIHVVREKMSHEIDDYGLTAHSVRQMEADMIRGARKKLQKEIDRFPQAKEIEVSSEAVIGDPPEEILKAQTGKGIDLIVISSLGKTGLAKYFIGSVARKVLKGSTCSVLLTKQEMLRPTKILVPTDFSEYSDKALKQGLDIGKQYNAKVFLLHVIPTRVQQSGAHEIERVKESMKQQLDKFPRSKEVEVITDIREGTSYEAILEEEKNKEIDLIVIASLGRTGLAKYLIGGVARNVLKGAKCPVLLTR